VRNEASASGSTQPSSVTETASTVQARLAAYRRDLYGGRGPGISEQDRLHNTSLRASVGGVPTAVSREELHLRTMRIRGQQTEASAELTWASSQFATRIPSPVAGDCPTQHTVTTEPPPTGNAWPAPPVRGLVARGWAIAAWVWSRLRRASGVRPVRRSSR
jgi:hypothetical protein